jgi:GxxExxY protein
MRSAAGLKHRELTEKIIGVFYEVYNELGHGFLESVYEKAFDIALTSKGLHVLRQIEVPVWFRGSQNSNGWLTTTVVNNEANIRTY